MAANWMRRTFVVAACASAALLAACGSSTIESALTPDRFFAFGDAFSDVGQKDVGQIKNARYTVNDGTVSNWTEQIATRYGKTIKPATSGGLSYATGNARVSVKPDAAGDATTLTVTEQIDRFFLDGGSFGANDVVFVNAGTSDVIAGMAAFMASTQTEADELVMLAAARSAGQQLGDQVRRLVNDKGAKHVLVMGVYNLSKSPWATAISQTTLLDKASSEFKAGLNLSIYNMDAKNVLYADVEYYGNLFTSTSTASSYGFSDTTTPVCTSVDAGNGIGIGTNQVNSALCTTSTLLSGASQDKYVFADAVYMTPSAHRQLGNSVYDFMRRFW